MLHIFVTADAVYEVLTIFGKDCGQHRLKEHFRLTGGPKLTFVQAQNCNDALISRKRRTGMALKVELKPHERIIIGNCVVTNTDQRARLLIDGDNVPILREKDIMTPETADTPAKLVYLAVQLMYISPIRRSSTAPTSICCAISSPRCRAHGRSSKPSTPAS